MTDAVLYFVLGLLAGGLLATILAPLLWRQAAHVTRKRVEAERPAVPVDTVTRASLIAALDEQEAAFRERVRTAEGQVSNLRNDLAAERTARELVEAQRAEASAGRMEADAELDHLRRTTGAQPADPRQTARDAKADNLRVKLLLRERDQLATENAELRRIAGEDEGERLDNARLRERLNEIAAHVMRLAETFEAAGASEPLMGDLARAVAALKDRPRYAASGEAEDETEAAGPRSLAEALAERIRDFQTEVRKTG